LREGNTSKNDFYSGKEGGYTVSLEWKFTERRKYCAIYTNGYTE